MEKKAKVDAILFSCMDRRLYPDVMLYFFDRDYNCDLCFTAGSLDCLINETTRAYFLNQIALSKKLHSCKIIILTMHFDCGVYGAFETREKEIAHHKGILEQAKKIIESAPDDLAKGMVVKKYIIEKDDDGVWHPKRIAAE